MNCSFCEDENLTSRTIYKDDLVVIFPSKYPVVVGHTLVCPARHVERIDDLSEKELKSITHFIVKLKEAMKKALGAEGFNIAFNEGEGAGQSVSHLHIHVLPRKNGDTGIYEYEPRKFLYRTDFESRKLPNEKELYEVSELIKNNL